MSWDEDAACKGASTEVFFPETSATGPRREALRFCRACPVRRECLTAALEVPADIDYGVFGGWASWRDGDYGCRQGSIHLSRSYPLWS